METERKSKPFRFLLKCEYLIDDGLGGKRECGARARAYIDGSVFCEFHARKMVEAFADEDSRDFCNGEM